MPKPLEDGFIPSPELRTIYEAPAKTQVGITFLSLFNSAPSTSETVVVAVSRRLTTPNRSVGRPTFGPEITIARPSVSAGTVTQVLVAGSVPYLFSGDRLMASTTTPDTVQFKLDGSEEVA